MRRFIATLIARPLRIERVDSLDRREDVWCLTVPDVGAFALANGAVVHNSDAFRYLAMAWRKAPLRKVKPPADPRFSGWVIPPPPEPRRGARL